MARHVLRICPSDPGTLGRRHIRRIRPGAVHARAPLWAAHLLGGRLQYPRSGTVDWGHPYAHHVPAGLATADAATAADGLLTVRLRRGNRVVVLAAARR